MAHSSRNWLQNSKVGKVNTWIIVYLAICLQGWYHFSFLARVAYLTIPNIWRIINLFCTFVYVLRQIRCSVFGTAIQFTIFAPLCMPLYAITEPGSAQVSTTISCWNYEFKCICSDGCLFFILFFEHRTSLFHSFPYCRWSWHWLECEIEIFMFNVFPYAVASRLLSYIHNRVVATGRFRPPLYLVVDSSTARETTIIQPTDHVSDHSSMWDIIL